jgi:hypothetical protein
MFCCCLECYSLNLNVMDIPHLVRHSYVLLIQVAYPCIQATGHRGVAHPDVQRAPPAHTAAAAAVRDV